MRLTAVFPLLILLAVSCGSPSSETISLGDPVRIKGTRMSIRPPEGFGRVTKFPGLQNGSCMIVFRDVDGASYFQSADFSNEALKKKGLEVKSRNALLISGFEGQALQLTGADGVRRELVYFGDSTFVAVVTAIGIPDDKAQQKAVSDALSSIVYDKKIQIATPSVVKLNDYYSKFKLAKTIDKTMVYAPGGEKKSVYKPGEPALLVMTFPADKGVTPSAYLGIVLQILEKEGVTTTGQISLNSTYPVNGNDANERIMEGAYKGKPISVYMLVVRNKKHVAVCYAALADPTRELMEEIRTLARTVEFVD